MKYEKAHRQDGRKTVCWMCFSPFLVVSQELFVDGVIQTHSNDTQKDPGTRCQDAAPSDHLHGKTHPQAKGQSHQDAEAVCKDIGRAFRFPVQFSQSNDLGGVLGGVFIGNSFRKILSVFMVRFSSDDP